MYPPFHNRRQTRSKEQAIKSLCDTANTFINFIEYTQLVIRDGRIEPIYVPDHQRIQVEAILNDGTTLKHLNEQDSIGT